MKLKQYCAVGAFNEGLARVEHRGWGLLDASGKEVIPYKYDKAEGFHEGLACVRLEHKYGYVDKTGREVI